MAVKNRIIMLHFKDGQVMHHGRGTKPPGSRRGGGDGGKEGVGVFARAEDA